MDADPGRPATPGRLPRHEVPPAHLVPLARGDGDPATLEWLRSAERSRRLMLLRALSDALARHRPPAGPLGPDGSAWELLTRAEKRAPDAVDAVLMHPPTGTWLALVLRRLRGTAPDEAPLWAVLGHLGALAAAAGVRAGLDFDVAVPARHGSVPLPTLGCAVLPGADHEPWAAARVRAAGGRVRVEGSRRAVPLPAEPGDDAPGWQALRRVTVGPVGLRLELALDDLDPYRAYPRPTEPSRLSDQALSHWRRLLAQAWTVLLRDEPQTAAALRRGLTSLTPTRPGERFRPHSMTVGDAFGGIVASEPDDAVQLAVTLVHEFQHTKLGGLLHLAPLCTTGPDAEAELFYAPWRDDPRPLEGLLQGIYAFAGVTRFWHAHRRADDPDTAALAQFEFALWRAQVGHTLRTVHRHERLTPLGLRFLDLLDRRCAAWSDEPVPAALSELARAAGANHRARWRAHHLRPAAPAVDAAVSAWRGGADRPPAALAAEPALVPDLAARRLDSVATLARHRLGDRGGPAPARVAGAVPGDTHLAGGHRTAAARAYLAQLAADPCHVAAWAGLGCALDSGDGDATHRRAARLLGRHPERALAVQRALLAATGRPADPLGLAAWLGAGPAGTP
ncbi:HEXXH motif domain-containing protein [Streptomyces sp. NPDC006733]|uniref:HEXXH motif domain-containing protein n=1 Tax=Streptomyces sp. NPDC006733 TaxID=3155460 RepID=UPI0033D27FF0